MNLATNGAGDDGENRKAAQNAHGHIDRRPGPMAFCDQAVIVGAERTERTKAATESDGQCCGKRMSVWPAGSEFQGDGRQEGSRNQVGGQRSQGKCGAPIEPDAKHVPEHGTCSTANEDADDEREGQGVHCGWRGRWMRMNVV